MWTRSTDALLLLALDEDETSTQGGDSTEDVLYQDNEAAMLLQKNGRMSCGKGSKHIHIRYFFITDKIMQSALSG